VSPDPPLVRSARLLLDAAERGARFLASVDRRSVQPDPAAVARLSRLAGPLPDGPTDPEEVLRMLDEEGSPATVASVGGRYFGFVIGGVLPASLGANTLAGAWDQCAGMRAASPLGAALEEAAGAWLLELLGLDARAGVGFVTGATTANLAAIAAARRALLLARGWDVERQGLFGAPAFPVVVGEEVHASVGKALGLLGLGRERVLSVPIDDQGRMRPECLPRLDEPALVCIQAGNVNSGAFDPAARIVEAVHGSGSWVHVDGAFGLWACASPTRAASVQGLAEADSWSLDAHKWLNVPYDSGMVIVRDPAHLRGAMRATAPYLVSGERPDPTDHTPEMSRRARGVEVWAALRSLGRAGVSELIERCCAHATRFAERLSRAGYEILNEVVLNQVLVSFGSDARTDAVVKEVQREGTCWCGGTTWRGRRAMRISVSSWATTEDDVERSARAMLAAAERCGAHPSSE